MSDDRAEERWIRWYVHQDDPPTCGMIEWPEGMTGPATSYILTADGWVPLSDLHPN